MRKHYFLYIHLTFKFFIKIIYIQLRFNYENVQEIPFFHIQITKNNCPHSVFFDQSTVV